MTYRTEKQAAERLCPVARTFHNGKSNCIGSQCILWRWRAPLAGDPEFVAAVKAEMSRMAEGTGKQPVAFHAKAASAVAFNPEGHGILPTLGYCGLGGNP